MDPEELKKYAFDWHKAKEALKYLDYHLANDDHDVVSGDEWRAKLEEDLKQFKARYQKDSA